MVPSDTGVHLCFGDIIVDSHNEPSTLRVMLKASKPDQFRKGVVLVIGRGNQDICSAGLYVTTKAQPLVRCLSSEMVAA